MKIGAKIISSCSRQQFCVQPQPRPYFLKVNKSIPITSGTNSKTKVSKESLEDALTLCQKSFNETYF